MPLTTGAVGTAETELTSQAVVRAVAAETGRDPLQLQPLYEVLDPDALDSLCSTGDSGTTPARIEFRYAGCEVRVSGDDEVAVTRLED